jgi:hypothetical protein
MHALTKPALSQKYKLMEYGYDQSLLIRPEPDDGPDQCERASLATFCSPSTRTDCCGVLSDLAFFPTQDCSGDPLLISPPASVLRERPVAGCSNYAAAGITTMPYKVV